MNANRADAPNILQDEDIDYRNPDITLYELPTPTIGGISSAGKRTRRNKKYPNRRKITQK